MSDCGDVKKVFVPTKDAPAQKSVVKKGVTIDNVAAEKITTFVKNEGHTPETHGLWVCVKKDGCSGLSYDMAIKEIAPLKENGDKVFTHESGANLLIDKMSYFYITGSILTYTEALTGSGFILQNPNIKGSCSCGSSFAV